MIRALALVAAAGLVLAQQPPKFEVASIKPNKSADNNGTWRYDDHGTFTGENIPVKFLIMTAFKLKESQLSSLPAWTDSEKYDIEAKVEGKTSQEQIVAMLQDLLADRFNFKYHRAKKTMAVYSLVQTKGGIKATGAADGPCPNDAICGAWFARRNQIEGTRITMSQLADALTFQLDRIVVDKTGLRKTFDIKLTWSPDPDPGEKSDDGDGASIFTAVQEQLGLKLEAAKAPVDILIVDRIERPSEN
jgi:uncharacterized protein (TIGR03435 family)